ncbi:MAG: hypothetical protein ACE5IM_07520, partial [Nitrospinota bacterium]
RPAHHVMGGGPPGARPAAKAAASPRGRGYIMSDAMDRFIRDVGRIVREGGTEEDVTARVAERMRALMEVPDLLSPGQMKTKAGGYVLRPVHIAEDGSFSIAAAVWDVGQVTPIHDHGTWGVIGIYRGVEHEERFRRSEDAPPAEPARIERTREWDARSGDVFVCCTSDKDIHRVGCGSDEPCVGIHVYGADIGAMERHAYDPETGAARTFVSGWD